MIATRTDGGEASGRCVRFPVRSVIEFATGASKRLHQSLQSSPRAVEPLARVDLFDLDNSTPTPTYSVDGVDAKPATTD